MISLNVKNLRNLCAKLLFNMSIFILILGSISFVSFAVGSAIATYMPKLYCSNVNCHHSIIRTIITGSGIISGAIIFISIILLLLMIILHAIINFLYKKNILMFSESANSGILENFLRYIWHPFNPFSK